jgi:hypothetical protein
MAVIQDDSLWQGHVGRVRRSGRSTSGVVLSPRSWRETDGAGIPFSDTPPVPAAPVLAPPATRPL